MTDRRTFIGAAACSLIAAPLAIRAQPAQKVVRLGYLREGTPPSPAPLLDALRSLGWVEGKNLRVEARYASGRDELATFAAELVRLKVDLIVTQGSPATRAARDATKTIPIVFGVGADPVQNGFVASLARPGGNLTGVTVGLYEPKRLQILKEALPGISGVAYPYTDAPDEAISRAAQALGMRAHGIALTGLQDFGPFFAEAKKAGADAVLIRDVSALVPQLERIGAETLKRRVPAVGFRRIFVDAGGLLFYGPKFHVDAQFANLIDKILRGADPASLPVYQPTNFELVINLKTAKAISLAIPQALLQRADEVIQ